jgi:oligoribonuclease NrnB/cAMP/cGMP phosphodiesterase (DHH superfamily)
MKTVCVYHSVDLDGWMSAAIVKYWFETEKQEVQPGIFLFRKDVDTLDFLGYNYGQPIPDLSGYDKVVMCDISFPLEDMLAMNNQLIWIDHHKSAIDSYLDSHKAYYKGLRDTKFSACELTWKYFFPDEPMPEIVRLLGRYDCFGHKGTEEETKVLEFQYGARSVISNYEEAYEELHTSITTADYSTQMIYEKGKSIYQYLCTEAKQSYKNGFEIIFDNIHYDKIGFAKDFKQYKFICINKERFNPINFGIDYHKEGYDGAACFHYANDLWHFSLYNDNGLVDCSVIAKQFGGGGHKGAAGFVLKDLSVLFKD